MANNISEVMMVTESKGNRECYGFIALDIVMGLTAKS